MRLRMADARNPGQNPMKDVSMIWCFCPQSAAAGNRTFTFVDLNQARNQLQAWNYYSSRGPARNCSGAFGPGEHGDRHHERPRRLLLISTDMYLMRSGARFRAMAAFGISLHIMEKPSEGTVLIPAADIAAAIAQASPD